MIFGTLLYKNPRHYVLKLDDKKVCKFISEENTPLWDGVQFSCHWSIIQRVILLPDLGWGSIVFLDSSLESCHLYIKGKWLRRSCKTGFVAGIYVALHPVVWFKDCRETTMLRISFLSWLKSPTTTQCLCFTWVYHSHHLLLFQQTITLPPYFHPIRRKNLHASILYMILLKMSDWPPFLRCSYYRLLSSPRVDLLTYKLSHFMAGSLTWASCKPINLTTSPTLTFFGLAAACALGPSHHRLDKNPWKRCLAAWSVCHYDNARA